MCCGAKVEELSVGMLFGPRRVCRKCHFKNIGTGYLVVTGKRYAKLAWLYAYAATRFEQS
jgi:hypothetical protein